MSSSTALQLPLRSVNDVVNGLAIHGRVGARELSIARLPLVFVHGLGMSVRYLEPTMALLAAEYPLAGLDLPGFGRSGSPMHAFDVHELTHALMNWLDVRAIGPAVFLSLIHI